MFCIECNSDNITKHGRRLLGKRSVKKYSCKDCGNTFYLNDEAQLEAGTTTYIPAPKARKVEKYVITSAMNDCMVDEGFLGAIETFCDKHNASLYVIPLRGNGAQGVYDPLLDEYILDNNLNLNDSLKVYSKLKISSTAADPLSGIDSLSKGTSIIIGHPQVQLKTLPKQHEKYPSILATTGSITHRNYKDTKAGEKASFNHSMSAVIVEVTTERFHIRHANYDGNGFYDYDGYYTSNGVEPVSDIEALITGDEHVIFTDPDVLSATYTNKNSILNVLKPKKLIRHDVLDCYSISHHHRMNVFTKYAKFHSGYDRLEDELLQTIDHINNTTPEWSESIIISSNHNDHLLRWLNEADPKIEIWNAKLYHELMYRMLDRTEMGDSGADYPNPFELYAEDRFNDNIRFVGRRESYRIKDIELSYHGDVGANGSRGSRKQFSILPSKTVIGHSHSPGILGGTYQVGTSSKMNLEYVGGPSSWHHAHVVIYPNGKRQMIFIVDGKWHA